MQKSKRMRAVIYDRGNAVIRVHLPLCVLCVQTKAKVRLLSAHKVYGCAPLSYWQNVGALYGECHETEENL